MRIAFVSQPWNRMVPPVEVGSVAILTYEAARRLAVEHEVTVYAKKDPADRSEEQRDGVRYRRFPVDWDRRLLRQLGWFNRFRNPKRALFASRIYYLGYITRVARDIQKEGYDVVQLFNFSQFASAIHARSPGTKVVLRMSCEWLTQLDPNIIRPRLAQTDAIFGCSDFITERIRTAFPEFARKCRTILNGRDVEYFASANDQIRRSDDRCKKVVYVGRVSPEKGVHVLVRAFSKVLGAHPDACLDIIGPKASTPRSFVLDLTDDPNVRALAPLFDEDYVANLQRETERDLSGRVVFRGTIPHRGLLREYQDAKLLVFPSIWDEPSGNPPIEAMAAGIPVVSTRTGGTPEYVEDGRTGVLVEPDNPDELADAINRLLGEENLRRQMGRAGQVRAIELFSYKRFVKDLVAMYQELEESCRSEDFCRS